jgi:hypothetical protein
MITLEKILGALTGRENLYRSGRNFNVIETEVNSLREQTNSFAPHLSDLVTDADGAHGLKIEEGTFTPTLAGGTVVGNHTYTIREGRYIKIGNRLFYDISIFLSAKDAAMSGIAVITGLPFASKVQGNIRYAGSIANMGNISFSAGTLNLGARVDGGATRVILAEFKTTSSTTLDSGAITASSMLYLSGSYSI